MFINWIALKFFSFLGDFNFEEYLMAFFVLGIIVVMAFFVRWFLYNFLVQLKPDPKQNFGKSSSDTNVKYILAKYFPYYKDLSPELQDRFLSRLYKFIQQKTFIPRQTEANETINLLIAATAIQLTFGLKDYAIFGFDKILIYPDTYYSEIRQTYHKGEINVKHRLIVLSAKHFLEGLKNPDDGINLGLHEFSHALNVQTFEERDVNFIKYYNIWKEDALAEMINIANDEKHFLRKYASTNIEEMFAVCTENFFERPLQFKASLPFLYEKMYQVYQQDPANKAKPCA